jgi:hypothetical protein
MVCFAVGNVVKKIERLGDIMTIVQGERSDSSSLDAECTRDVNALSEVLYSLIASDCVEPELIDKIFDSSLANDLKKREVVSKKRDNGGKYIR